jgi:hypothetical protein
VDLSHTQITVIPVVAFGMCKNLLAVLLPVGITEISKQAFYR